MVADKIKTLRELNNYTQQELAKNLGITRACVNSWEMGISKPSTQYLVRLSRLFEVSTDYLLGLETTAAINVTGLDEEDLKLVYYMIEHLKEKNKHRK